MCSRPFIDLIMIRLGIHEHNVSIVAYGLHMEVGVGFPCWDCAHLTSYKAPLRDLEQTPHDVPTHTADYWFQ